MGIFTVPCGGKKRYINHDDISCMVAEDTTCYFLLKPTGQKKECERINSTRNLGHFAKKLNGSSLLRCHRKYIVNKNEVDYMNSRYELEMKHPISVVPKVSRRQRKYFKQIMDS